MRRDQPGNDTGQLELPEVLFAAVFIPIAAFSWVGLLLAELGAFSGWRVGLAGAVVAAIALAIVRRELLHSWAGAAPTPVGRWALFALLIAISAAVFSRPGEYVIEGADASVYLATGRHIERTGGIRVSDPVVHLMPDELRSTFFVVGRQGRQQEVRFPGGLPIGREREVHPSFFHLLPVWIAIATAAAGPMGGYYVNVVVAVLGVFLVALIGRRLWSPAAGFVAAGLLLVNFGQIFHARIPSSEMLAQFSALSTIFFTLLAWDNRSRLAGACAGAAAGLATFTRVDAFLLVVVLAVCWLVLTRQDRSLAPARKWYAIVLGLLAAHAIVHASTIAQLYVYRLVIDGWPRLKRVVTYMGPLTSVVLIASVALCTFLILRYRRRSLVMVGVCAAVALAVLPMPMMVMLNQLLTPVGLTAAAAGLALVFATRWDPRVLLVAVPLIVQTGLLLVWTETMMLPGDFRRAIPLTLPVITLLIGFLTAYVASGKTWFAQAIWLLPLGLGARFVVDSAPFIRTPVMQGVEQQVAAIAGEIPPDAIVISDGSVPGHLALALQFAFERPAVRLFDRPPGKAGISPFISAALAGGRRVYAAVAPFTEARPQRIWRSDFADFDIRHLKTLPLSYTYLAPTRAAFPRTFRTDDLPVALYEVAPLDRNALTPLPFLIDVGGDDFRPLVDGFHASEQIQGTSARWTNGDARISVPRLAPPASGALTLVLRVSADRPQGQAPPVVRITFDGISAGTTGLLTSKLSEYRIALPPEVLARLTTGPTMMSMTSDFFVPNAAGVNGDSRQLGIVVDWIRIE